MNSKVMPRDAGDRDQNIQQVMKTIDDMREEIIELCSNLVRRQSVNPKYPDSDSEKYLGGEKACNEFLAAELAKFGCKVDLFEKAPQRANLVGTLKGGGGGRSLIMNGHIDTVPFGNLAMWTNGDPLSGTFRDGKLFGRGACDMKAGIAAFCKAAEAITKAYFSLKGDLILESVVGEETMDHLLGTTATVDRGYRADAAIVAEPTSLSLNPVTQGVLLMSVMVEGKSAHTTSRDLMIRPGGGGDEIGVNAIEKGVKVLEAIQQLEFQWGMTKIHPLYNPGHFVLHPGIIEGAPSGHKYVAVVPDYCRIDYAVLYKPDESEEAVKREIEEYVFTASKLDTWLSRHPPKFQWTGSWPSGEIAPDHPICQAVRLGHQVVTGESNLLVRGMPAPVDVPFLDNAGIPTVAIGPGDLPQAHSENEFVSVEQLVTATKIYAITAMQWCGYLKAG
jgi:formylaminopyrimidine deformylase